MLSRFPRKASTAALVAAFAVLTGAGSASAAPKDAQAVRPGTVIYKIDPGASARDLKALNALLNSQGLVSERELEGSQLRIATFDQPGREKAIASILKRSAPVLFAEPDYEVAPTLQPNDPAFDNQWHHGVVGSQQAWEVTTGSSVLVGVCDTGFDVNHPDLAANLRTDLAFNAQDGSDYIFDANGHGTGTAGTLGAVGNNATGVAGMNWNIDIIPVRIAISDSNSSAYISTMARCIEYAADQGARVVNLSYGGIQYATIDSAARYLRSRGGLLFMSAGNSGQEQATYPDYTSFVGVGATDQNDNRASFSSWGSYVDVTGPGVGIRTTYPGNRYVNYSGTSFSSPLTAGVAALMVAANPALSVEDIENGLFSTALDLGAAGDDDVFGHGRVDAAAAVSYAVNLDASTPPRAAISASSTSVTFGQSVFLSAQGSADPDGRITAYQWDLGDGSVYTTEDVTHTYAAAGAYEVSLTVTDDDNLTGSETISIRVTNEPPEAIIDSMVTSYYVGDTVNFSATGSFDPDGEIVEYAWDFGDLQTAAGETVEHVYMTGGSFLAELTVTDNAGAMATATLPVEVFDPGFNNAPTASFTASCTELACSFDAGGSFDIDGDMLSYSWEFGDQATASGEITSHAYEADGSYTVTLTVTDSNLAADSATRVVDVAAESSDITLSVSGFKSRGTVSVDLIWSNALGDTVEIHRRKNKDIQVFTTVNDGAYQDTFGGGGSFSYRVCETGGAVCSAEQAVSF